MVARLLEPMRRGVDRPAHIDQLSRQSDGVDPVPEVMKDLARHQRTRISPEATAFTRLVTFDRKHQTDGTNLNEVGLVVGVALQIGSNDRSNDGNVGFHQGIAVTLIPRRKKTGPKFLMRFVPAIRQGRKTFLRDEYP